jgi:hypothetical protein
MSRTPPSAQTLNTWSPEICATIRPVHFAENVAWFCETGICPCCSQSKSISLSTRVTAGVPERSGFVKYWPWRPCTACPLALMNCQCAVAGSSVQSEIRVTVSDGASCLMASSSLTKLIGVTKELPKPVGGAPSSGTNHRPNLVLF